MSPNDAAVTGQYVMKPVSDSVWVYKSGRFWLYRSLPLLLRSQVSTIIYNFVNSLWIKNQSNCVFSIGTRRTTSFNNKVQGTIAPRLKHQTPNSRCLLLIPARKRGCSWPLAGLLKPLHLVSPCQQAHIIRRSKLTTGPTRIRLLVWCLPGLLQQP